MKKNIHRTERGFTAASDGAENPSAPRGFTLLLAVLVSSVLIALGSAIYSIVSKEIALSSAGRESQFSFYSADTGIECALYWDLKQDAFSTTSTQTSLACGGSTVDLTAGRTLTGAGTASEQLVTVFSFPINGTAITNPCASVSVTRQYYPVRTTVVSSGYNTCDAANPIRLERAIRVSY